MPEAIGWRARLVDAFSLRRNFRALFVPRPDAIAAVTGLRGLSMLWVLMQHVQQGLRPLGGTPAGAAFLAHPILGVGWSGNLAIETFFVISGYLIGGMLMKEREASGTIQLESFYVRRALRILPAYVVAMGVNLCLPSVNKASVWANALFVNNFLPFREQFMAHCWSLAIEEQFFWISPFVVFALYYLRVRHRAPVLAFAFALACAVGLLTVFGEGIELSMRFPNAIQFWRYMDVFYTKPHTRFGSLALGMLVAELERDGHALRFLERHPYVASLLGGLSIAGMLSVMSIFPECRGPAGDKLAIGAVRIALNGYLFGAGIAFFLLLTRTQHPIGRALDWFLARRTLHVFAQLSFAMYLLHPAVITPLFPRVGFDLASPWLSYLRIFGASLAVATSVGAVVFLFVELPVMRLRPRPSGAAAGPPEVAPER